MKLRTKLIMLLLLLFSIIALKLFWPQGTLESNVLQDKEYMMWPCQTTYRDYQQLNEGALDSEYSYSSLRYGSKTKMEIVDYGGGAEVYVDNDITSDHPCSTFTMRVLQEGQHPKILIKNCAVDGKGRSMDVLVGLDDFQKYNEIGYIEASTNSMNGSGAGGYDQVGIGSPILFALVTYGYDESTGSYRYSGGGDARFDLTYYYHPADERYYMRYDSDGNYVIDYTRLERADINKVNGFYYDMDIYRSSEDNVRIFTDTYHQRSRRN